MRDASSLWLVTGLLAIVVWQVGPSIEAAAARLLMEDGRLVVAMSANAWEMHRHALDNASVYRPFVITLPWPAG